jgi:hypothetical protein
MCAEVPEYKVCVMNSTEGTHQHTHNVVKTQDKKCDNKLKPELQSTDHTIL